MQIKIEIKINEKKYKVKVDDELTISEVLTEMQLTKVEHSKLNFYIQTRKAHMLADHHLKDFGLVNNDVIEIIM